MALRRLELALPSVGRRRFLTAVSGGGITPASFSGLVLWSETVAGKVFTTSGGSTAAGNTDLLGRIDSQQPGLPALIQATAGNRPTLGLDASGRLEVRGNGSGVSLTPSPAVSALTDFTAYAIVTHTAAAICAPYASTSGSGVSAFLGLYSDGNAYFLPGDGTALVVACTVTGNVLIRCRRSGTSVRFAATGFTDAAMTVSAGASPGASWTPTAFLAREGSDGTASGNGFSKLALFNRALATAEMLALEQSYFGGAL